MLVYTSRLQRRQQAHWDLGELGREGGVLLSHILLGARAARKWSWEPLGVYDNSGLSLEPTRWLRLQSRSGEEQIPRQHWACPLASARRGTVFKFILF